MNIRFKTSLMLILMMYLSCTNANNPLDLFLHKLEEKIGDQKELSRFMNAPKSAVITSYERFSEEFTALYWDSTYHQEINNYFNSKGISEDPGIRVPILLFAFQQYLKGESINISILAEETKKYYENTDTEYNKREKVFIEENKRLAEVNSKRWKIGDTLTIILPVDIDDHGRRSTFYYSYGYPVTLDYSSADDSLIVSGILLKKKYEVLSQLEHTALDSSSIIFELKILKLSNEDTQLLNLDYKTGDTFDLHLKEYGRAIQ